MTKSLQVTTREAAAALRVSIRTVQRRAASGKLNATKDTTGRWVITLTADALDSDDQRNAAGGWVDRGSDGSAGNVGRYERGLVAAVACR
ncbi:helix-turn-helix domain-containing protein [Streptosporangium sp. NPDC002524]|uniref:helix-turn-helix domain-containing protein n=1 Tax=Streptosporangium sp. NPDC002524 TaxID=3154537 RepID=UPI00332D9B2F